MENNEVNKLDMKSADIVGGNIEKIEELFPNVVKEGKIDFNALKQELSNDLINEKKEKYQLTWAGKNDAIIESNRRINKTLRPCVQESVNFDNTKNIFIEGDNLEALKLLQESYINKIDLIYIDPPYNTGKDFVYKDKFKKENNEELQYSGQMDEYNNKLVTNATSNGRFHSDWLSMIYPRLKLSRALLKKEGLIFISIDDNEVDNLRKCCDEILGERNFVAQIIIDGTPKNDPYIVSTAHEYCLVYVKDFDAAKDANYGITNPLYEELIKIYETNKDNYTKTENDLRDFFRDNNLSGDNISNYKYADKDGIYRIGPIDDPQRGGPKDTRINPRTGRACVTPKAGWRCNLETWNEWIKKNLIMFPEDDNVLPAKKTYITNDRKDVMKAYFKMQTRKDTDYLKNLFGLDITPFSNPKPRELLKSFIENMNNNHILALDFFAGSGSFADAMLNYNLENNSKNQFILVQLPEKLEVNSNQSGKEKKITEAAIKYLKEHGLPSNVAEITKERIRKVGIYAKENNPNIDYGFRVYKIDSSNMKDVYYEPSKLNQAQLNMFESNIKEDRTAEDLLTQVILDLGLTLDLRIEEKNILNNKVYFVAGNSLVACFDNQINIDMLNQICEVKPLKVVFRESSFRNDSDKINAYERIKKLSPETEINVI